MQKTLKGVFLCVHGVFFWRVRWVVGGEEECFLHEGSALTVLFVRIIQKKDSGVVFTGGGGEGGSHPGV